MAYTEDELDDLMNSLSDDSVEITPEVHMQWERASLRAKLRKDTGQGDIATLDAVRSKIELEKTLGTLFTRETVADALVAEHINWIKHLESLSMDVLATLVPLNLAMSLREEIKSAVDKAVSDVRSRVAYGGTSSIKSADDIRKSSLPTSQVHSGKGRPRGAKNKMKRAK